MKMPPPNPSREVILHLSRRGKEMRDLLPGSHHVQKYGYPSNVPVFSCDDRCLVQLTVLYSQNIRNGFLGLHNIDMHMVSR